MSELKKLVTKGEGPNLEFKRKAAFPEKLAREMVAFANTDGGILMVGVDDDKSIPGCKFPEEEVFAIESFLNKACHPRLKFRLERVPLNPKREVLVYHIPPSRRKPHFLVFEGIRQTFVRSQDMSIVASREMIRLLRTERKKSGVSIRIGDREKLLFQHLEKNRSITLNEAGKLLKTNHHQVSGLLVLLVRAGLLTIQPSEKGDFFSLAAGAFE
ncbi:MAG: ATP-binding protein [Bacteroidia bacterium]|nr:ATP-binding protein [Bacteroidia bacterium]